MQNLPDPLPHHNHQSCFSTTYAFSSLSYFLSPSEIIDYQIGKAYKLSVQAILSNLQQTNFTLPNALALFSYLFDQSISQKQQPSKPLSKTLKVSSNHIRHLLENDSLKIVYSLITLLVSKLQSNEDVIISQELLLKSLINIFYVFIYWIEKDSLQKAREGKNLKEIATGSPYLNTFYKDVDIDTFLIKLLTLSLQFHFIPIKKVSMIYTKVLANIFSYQSTNGKGNIFIHPVSIFNDSALQKLPIQNTLQQNYLEKLKEKSPPLSQLATRRTLSQPIEQFYRKNNIGDCPLAQSIVVGLLRSLLTICNSQTHKKFTTIKGAGVDSFRQWQLSYRYAIQNMSLVQSSCQPHTLQRIKEYQQFDRSSTEKTEPQKTNPIFQEFYMHKIYTTSVITNFFMIILLGLKMNVFIQYSYFLQLISDANGILVFLKFLTDKFQGLEEVDDRQLDVLDGEQMGQEGQLGTRVVFKDKVMLTVYSILNMLHCSCNNYPEKVKNYLFEYNSYLIIKKIPVLFFPALKNPTLSKQQSSSTQVKKKDELQGSLPNLPSKQQLQQLINIKKSQQPTTSSEQAPLIIRRLTQTCYDLLKIQIPYFSKKMKDTNNMKMLIDIYCRFPKTVDPIKRTALQKIQLKCKSKKQVVTGLQGKAITSVEEMKNMHNQYNNVYYWSNDFVNQMEAGKVEVNRETGKGTGKDGKNKEVLNAIDPNFDYQEWLEEHLWKYYD